MRSTTFCGVCTPEERNNKSWLGKATYFISTRGLGNQTVVVGAENFAETRIANNHQSGSDYTITNSGNIINGSDVFPRFDPSEVIELASAGEHLPAGITRHVIQWRALRVNIPLALCEDRERSIEDKNAWLQGWLAERWSQGNVRFYEEPTVMFDE